MYKDTKTIIARLQGSGFQVSPSLHNISILPSCTICDQTWSIAQDPGALLHHRSRRVKSLFFLHGTLPEFMLKVVLDVHRNVLSLIGYIYCLAACASNSLLDKIFYTPFMCRFPSTTIRHGPVQVLTNMDAPPRLCIRCIDL